MPKIIYFLFFVLLISACNVIRNDRYLGISENVISNLNVQKHLKENNITNKKLFISKADIELNYDNAIEKFLCSIKFSPPDKYLVSVKSKAGIEGFRIFISGDTLLLNDRLNRKYLHGSTDYVRLKFGILKEMIPVIFGDFIVESNISATSDECVNNLLRIDDIIMGRNIMYLVDCKENKIVKFIQQNDLGGKDYEILFSSFKQNNGSVYPSSIKIIYDRYRATIKIKKITIPWEGDVLFIPGKGYESLSL